MSDERPVDFSRIAWAGPLTVVTAIAANVVVRLAAVATLSFPPEGFLPLGWFFPIFDTLVFVTAAVGVFALVARFAKAPIRTYWWIALAVLALSMIPDLRTHARRPDWFTWPRTAVLMTMHVVAWWVTVTMLARLTTCSKSER